MTPITLALPIIKQFEGCRLVAYLCPACVWTIGWGATGPDIVHGTVWTQQQADARLAADVSLFAQGVARLARAPATPNQMAALICFSYNVGLTALAGSTLLRLFNAGDTAGTSAQFMRWNKAGGRVLAGLTRRRAAERALFDGR